MQILFQVLFGIIAAAVIGVVAWAVVFDRREGRCRLEVRDLPKMNLDDKRSIRSKVVSISSARQSHRSRRKAAPDAGDHPWETEDLFEMWSILGELGSGSKRHNTRQESA